MKRSIDIREVLGNYHYGGSLRVEWDDPYGVRIAWESFEGGGSTLRLDGKEAHLLAKALAEFVAPRYERAAEKALAEGPYQGNISRSERVEWHGSIIEPDGEPQA